ncbi:single-stranded DNA-binding protein [uncultured Campylobacter sp.]|uniref:single-stranded DNA-binding protein n=1 Tax=uncultured Campylobacter sp. TaxID=218934 RepID=UPI0026385E44|nr:single-stranded DNA-binding protein [uncultured Campylobacter sp.]
MNKVVLIGNLTRDIELRYTQSGYCVGNAGIAVTRKFKNAQGETVEETCFIDLKFFGRTAEVANQYLRKGSKLAVEGRLKLEQWQDQSGQNRSKHVVEVESLEMLGGNQGGQNNQSSGTQNYAQSGGTQGGQAPSQSRKPALRSADKYDDGNDTIPF